MHLRTLLVFATTGFAVLCNGQQYTFLQPKDIEPTLPDEPLTFGDLNVIHTTDIHGWIRGHVHADVPPEINYSGNLGDIRSFVEHMKSKAAEQGKDLLLVDTGDHHDGNAIFDLDEPKGHTGIGIISKMPYDLMAVGNHELYNYSIALDTYNTFHKTTNSKYLASNVDIVIPSLNKGEPVPFGARYHRFRTPVQNRMITSFGFLFDFKVADDGLITKPTSEVIKEPWFDYALSLPTDAFVLIGHMTSFDDDWKLLHDAIRKKHPTKPILNFGGHAHIRDCKQFDDKSMLLASGRFLETVGWMSVKDIDANPQFERKYLDNNIEAYQFYTNTNQDNFTTEASLEILNDIDDLTRSFNLSHVLAYIPKSYYLDRVPITNPSSLINLFINKILPSIHSQSKQESPRPNHKNNQPFYLVNTGSFRFDMYKGDFTTETRFMVFPFNNGLRYIPDMPLSLVSKLVQKLNADGFVLQDDDDKIYNTLNDIDQDSRSFQRQSIDIQVDNFVRSKKVDAYNQYLVHSLNDKNYNDAALTEGYVTSDTCPGTGDDTKHRPIPTYPLPAYASTEFSHNEDQDSHVELVFLDYIMPFMFNALKQLDPDNDWTMTYPYSKLKANEVLQQYAIEHWS